MILAVAAAVARDLDDDGLWGSVAQACSPHLRARWFRGGDYPQAAYRRALEDACIELGVRQQIGLAGKHHYWRTIMLQFGFSGLSAARHLPLWISGYNVPETVSTLLGDDLNGSHDFQAMWETLSRWVATPEDARLEAQLERNQWYPKQSHTLLKEGILRDRPRSVAISRIEDEERNPTIFDVPRLSDGHFCLRLARHLPPDLKHAHKPVTMLVGTKTFRLLPNQEHGLQLQEDILLPAYDILSEPSQEVSLFLPGGRAYRERLAFWDETSDVVFFSGAQGRRREVSPRLGENAWCALVVRAGLVVHAGAQPRTADLSSPWWSIHIFPSGLPYGLVINDQFHVVWSAEGARSPSSSTSVRGRLEVREDTLLRLNLRVLPPQGWDCSSFRFAGRTHSGAQVEITTAPGISARCNTASGRLQRGTERADVMLESYVHGSRAAGAAYQDNAGRWNLMRESGIASSSGSAEALPADAATYEGRPLIFQWNAEPEMDVWLTLGEHGLFPEPHLVRRQAINATGEAFQLRVGLMNETGARMVFAPMYSTGSLARVEYAEGLIRLHLRDDVPGSMEYNVAVWERHQPLPRDIDPAIMEARGSSIDILDIDIEEPLGWAISFNGEWRGARFAVEPGSPEWNQLQEQWCTVLEEAPNWHMTAKALCAWRFPVLMQPYLKVVHSRVEKAPVDTLFAWTERSSVDSCRLTADPRFYEAPLRQLLWNVTFDEAAVDACWARHLPILQDRPFAHELYPPAERLLLANPVLLVKLLGDGLLRRYREGIEQLPKVRDSLYGKIMKTDPVSMKRHRKSFRENAQFLLLMLKNAFGGDKGTSPENLSSLEREALSGLRSWCDNRPIDDHYFHKYVRDVAEALYASRTADPKQLRLAIARSPLCCAYLASFLFCRNVFSPLQKEEI